MSGDTREVLFQLLSGVLALILVAVLVSRLRRPPRRETVLAVAIPLFAVIVAIGLLEARILAAIVLGAGIGVAIAGSRALIRAQTARADAPRAALALLALVVVSALPLAAIDLPLAGDSILRLTRLAAETSNGSWVVAWGRSWQLVLDPGNTATRVPLTAIWILALVGGLLLVATGVDRVTRVPLRASSPTPSTAPRQSARE